jgi:hypothetical protein
VPLPRRPQALTAVRQADGRVELAWSAALDCDGGAVSGYHLYRRLSTEAGYTRLTATPLAALSHTDEGVAGAAAGAVYYYALAAVDSAGDESVKSAPASVTIPEAAGSASAAAGGGGGCFVETVRPYDACASAVSTAMAFFAALGTLSLRAYILIVSSLPQRRHSGGSRNPVAFWIPGPIRHDGTVNRKPPATGGRASL